MKTYLGAIVKKTGDKNIDRSSMVKSELLPGLGEERGTPPATSRPLDLGST